MQVYMIKFPDKSLYIGATKTSAKNRLSNHLSKWRSGKYQIRDIYLKMSEFNGECELVVLSEHDTLEEMYSAEKSFINLFSSMNCLNNSTGGATCKGKKVGPETRLRIRDAIILKNPEFEAYDNKGNLLYKGQSMTKCSDIIKCTVANISYALKRIKDNVPRKRKNTSSYEFKITGGVLSL